MSDLIERLEKAADDRCSLDCCWGGTMLEAAAALKAPLPEEVAALAAALKKLAKDSLAFSPEIVERTLHWKAANALERMARDDAYWNATVNDLTARIAELEAERDAIEAATIERCADRLIKTGYYVPASIVRALAGPTG